MLRLKYILPTLLLLAACNTVEGLGQDTSKAGDSLSKAARDVQSKF